jgi:hypothetical protein
MTTSPDGKCWPVARPSPSPRNDPDAGALTQAIGTRSGDHLQPHIQRLMLDETGILLLCSDGLSDNYRIEDAWANYIGLIVKDIVTLDAAVASWIELANQKNGHDNTAVVLIQHKLPMQHKSVAWLFTTLAGGLIQRWMKSSTPASSPDRLSEIMMRLEALQTEQDTLLKEMRQILSDTPQSHDHNANS